MSKLIVAQVVEKTMRDWLQEVWSTWTSPGMTGACNIGYDPLGVGSGWRWVYTRRWPNEESGPPLWDSTPVPAYPDPRPLQERLGYVFDALPGCTSVYGSAGSNITDKVLAFLTRRNPWDIELAGIWGDNNWLWRVQFIRPQDVLAGAALPQDNPRKSGVWRCRDGTKDRIIRRVSGRFSSARVDRSGY